MSIGPKLLCGRRRYQYKPARTGPRMKSAFWTASQPGYVRKSADSVTHKATTDAATAVTTTATCQKGVAPRTGRAASSARCADARKLPAPAHICGYTPEVTGRWCMAAETQEGGASRCLFRMWGRGDSTTERSADKVLGSVGPVDPILQPQVRGYLGRVRAPRGAGRR